jgi:hypothetical protein
MKRLNSADLLNTHSREGAIAVSAAVQILNYQAFNQQIGAAEELCR